MAKIKKFEEIESWKKARGLPRDIYGINRGRCSRVILD